MSEHPLNTANGEQQIQANILKSLSARQRAQFSQKCRWREYDAGAVILEHGEASDHVLFVQNGRVRASQFSNTGREISYRDIGPGQTVGEFSAIDGAPRSASVMALETTLVAAMPATVFRSMVYSNPSVAEALMISLVGLLRGLTDRVQSTNTQHLGDRLYDFLMEISHPIQGSDRRRIDRIPSHRVIAARLSSHRETVTRELKRLEDEGLIWRDGKCLEVLGAD
ncbi:MAG: Crp/Fnr family transcriptional regulator [Litorivicinus sp.]